MARQERERRYISEYMLDTFPEGDYQLNVPLGPIPEYLAKSHGPVKAASIYRPTRPRVDAVKWTPDRYIVIEAKVREAKTGIGDLTFYRSLVPQTIDLPWYDGQPITYRLVVPWSLDWLNAAAEAEGLEIVIYSKPWIDEYIKERQNYFTAEYREERAEKMRLRKALGVD